jgi:23S rRNA (uracil1939-C5)-methyltransferase
MKPRQNRSNPAQADPGTSPRAVRQASAVELVEIIKPIYGGAFLARVGGKAVFVPLTLPAEQARVRMTQEKRGYGTAEAEEIVIASPQRILPACRHFGACGGCHYQHADYAAQLAMKQAVLRETLERAGVKPPAEIAMLAGEPWRYRNRIRLAFDAEGNPGYRGRRSHAVIAVSECPIVAPTLLGAAKAAAEIAHRFAPALRPAEIALFCNQTETALLASVFAGSAAGIRWGEFAPALHERIPALQGAELVAEARPGKQNAGPPRVLARWGATFLHYRAAGFDYRVDHGAFFQVNRWLVDALVERVTAGRKGALVWDLFAGVGLFARQLSNGFDRVVAVESSSSASMALVENLRGTAGSAAIIDTIEFLRRNRKGQRPDVVVADPPRTGLGAEATTLLAEIAAPALVYVSCDPATLARDLRALTGAGYEIESLTLADLFPQTYHLETVVELRRC